MIISLVLLGIFIFLVLFYIKYSNKNSFIATDGSSFKSQSDLDLYHDLLLKLQPLFSSEDVNTNSESILVYDKIFLNNLRTDGFKDQKTIIKYRNQFKALSLLINP